MMRVMFAAATSLLALTASPALAAECGDLADMRLDDGEVVLAQVVSAGAFEVPASAGGAPPGVAASPFEDVPAFCRVQMVLRPSADSDIRSEVWLPLEGWNGRYVGIGNGIWAGQISYAELGRTLARNYVAASTDTGHRGNGLTAEWAVGHPEKLVDFGYRAVHVTTLAAKQAIEEFYGEGPEFSLWNSCSTGGRQGLMSAYRYPEDFDAISAMAPANPMTDLMIQTMWTGWMTKRFENAALTPADLGMVHDAVLEQCDALDGLADGVISRPLECRFDPAALQCKAGEDQDCLTGGQVNALRGIYAGVRASDGTSLLPGFPYGAEMQLAALVMGDEPFPVATSYFRDLVFAGEPEWDWRAMDYALDLAAARQYGADILDVPADGLDAFFARGGKLLLSHGWNDGLIPAHNTLAFHHALYNDLPQEAAQDQLRLFMAPGMDHCSGGEGPSQFDTLGVIDAWTSTGAAPNRIVATRPRQVPSMPGAPQQPPREPMSRPLCAYPLVAQYDGEGDPMEAESFSCGMP